MAFSLNARLNRSTNGVQTTTPNNKQIVDYQARVIGKIESDYASGLINRAEYVRLYAQYSAIIRALGKS